MYFVLHPNGKHQNSLTLSGQWKIEKKNFIFFLGEILIVFSHSPMMPWFGESSDYEKIFFSGLSLPWAVYSLEKSA